jgi:long-chain acyl-CoA synthetase
MAEADELFAIDVIDVRGVPTKVFRHAPPSLRAIWDASLAHGDATYLVYGDERLTFAEAHAQVRALAHRLRTWHDVRQGDRVAIATRNHPEWAIAFWATVGIGAVAVPLNAWWTGPELAYGLADSGAVVLVADDERLERIEPHLGRTAVRATIGVRTERGDVPWAEAVAGEGPPLPEVAIDPEDDATIMYTSGTTGRPKGAVATHRNFGAFLMNALHRAAAGTSAGPAATAPPSTLLTFPLFHVGGLQSFLLPFTASGGKVVLMYRWDAEEAVDLVEREQVTTVAGVPTTVFQLLEAAAAKGAAMSSLAGISSGATLVPPELVRQIDARDLAPGNGYGLTETSGAGRRQPRSGVRGEARQRRPARLAGHGGAHRRCRRRAGPPGEVGEIWLKGPTVVRGYFNLPEETASSFTDGWFHTGDLGRLDDDGFLFVVDRLKDVVIRGGENVYAAEVEAALYEHPAVTEAAVIGVPHERLGEEVGAVLRVRDGATVTEDDVRAWVAERLAAFKVPSRVWLTDEELPRNASGKVLKRELRATLEVEVP